MRIEQLMTKQVHCCQPENTLEQAAQLMWDNDCGCLPVCAENGSKKLAGIITDRDIAMCAFFQKKPLQEICVSEAMERNVRTCSGQDSLADAEQLMREAKIRRLPVVNQEGCIIGMLSFTDLAQEAVKERAARTKEITESEISDTYLGICRPHYEPMSASM